MKPIDIILIIIIAAIIIRAILVTIHKRTNSNGCCGDCSACDSSHSRCNKDS